MEINGKTSDGYHTFDELYDHRMTLYIALCKFIAEIDYAEALDYTRSHIVWRSKKHSDGSVMDGWFLLGIDITQHQQITYHLPLKLWKQCGFADTFEQGPPFDGHTPEDVLKRLKKL